MLFTRDHAHAKNSILEKPNVTRKFKHSHLKTSEVGHHLLPNRGSNITWQERSMAPTKTFKRKKIEAFFI